MPPTPTDGEPRTAADSIHGADESGDDADDCATDEAEPAAIRVEPVDGPGTERYVEEAPFEDDSAEDSDGEWERKARDRSRRQRAEVADEDDDL